MLQPRNGLRVVVFQKIFTEESEGNNNSGGIAKCDFSLGRC